MTVTQTDLYQQLIRGRLRIEKGWTYGTMARCNGAPVGFSDPDATCWCAYGAVAIPSGFVGDRDPLEVAAMKELNTVIREGLHPAVPHWLKDGGEQYVLPPIVLFNDKTLKDLAEKEGSGAAQKVLLEVFDIAIKRVEARHA